MSRPEFERNRRRDRPEREERRRKRRDKIAARDMVGASPKWNPAFR